jgi:predicted N-formylglutamate amidohydrolase
LSRPGPSGADHAEVCGPLLGPGDPDPVIIERPDGASPFLLVCDHNGRAVPRRLGRLGVPEAEFERHIAWDIGAGAVASELGRRLGACVVRQAYSRLVVDCNRPLHVESLIPEVSDGTPIPANQGLTPAQRLQRIAAIHAPYHDAIERLIRARLAERRPVMLISVHSFTPAMNDFARPWRFGVLHGGDSPFSARMLEALRAEEGEAVGDNQPYALGPFDCTVPQHAQARGVDYLELEIRQDLIDEADGQRAVAAKIERLLLASAG